MVCTHLVVVHELEALLEFGHLMLGEHGEDIGTGALGLLRGTLGGSPGFGGWCGGRGGCCLRCVFLLLGLLNLLFLVRLYRLSLITFSFPNCHPFYSKPYKYHYNGILEIASSAVSFKQKYESRFEVQVEELIVEIPIKNNSKITKLAAFITVK